MSAIVTNEGSVMCYTMVFKSVRVVLKVAICKGLGTFLAIPPELFYQISFFGGGGWRGKREEGSKFCGYLMWHNCGWFSCYHGDGCKGNKDSLGFCEI